MKIKYTCECGSILLVSGKNKHEKSKKHLNFIGKTTIPKIKEVKSRANVDFNGMELVCAVLCKYPDIDNYKDLIKKILNIIDCPCDYPFIKFNDVNAISHYYNDIVKKNKILNKYITNFNQTIKNRLNLSDITVVFLCGKTSKHIEINKLNRNVHKLDAKSDIYLKFRDGSIAGISVKQDSKATKSNYSVQKILGNEVDQYLSDIKLKYLTINGFPEFNKVNRSSVNKLFYPNVKDNTYMMCLRNQIDKNSISIAKTLSSHLYCSNVPYDVYEFDGVEITKLNIKIETNLIFREHMPYYYTKKGNQRKTAKLFYKLYCNEKTYRVEIRWKGSVYCSPQFQIHEE